MTDARLRDAMREAAADPEDEGARARLVQELERTGVDPVALAHGLLRSVPEAPLARLLDLFERMALEAHPQMNSPRGLFLGDLLYAIETRWDATEAQSRRRLAYLRQRSSRCGQVANGTVCDLPRGHNEAHEGEARCGRWWAHHYAPPCPYRLGHDGPHLLRDPVRTPSHPLCLARSPAAWGAVQLRCLLIETHGGEHAVPWGLTWVDLTWRESSYITGDWHAHHEVGAPGTLCGHSLTITRTTFGDGASPVEIESLCSLPAKHGGAHGRWVPHHTRCLEVTGQW